MENKFCDTCCKEDVCMFKEESAKAANDIKDVVDRTNVFLKSTLTCHKWVGKTVNLRKEFGGDTNEKKGHDTFHNGNC